MSAQHHVYQSRANSCMAACLCMCLRRIGKPTSERAVLARWDAAELGAPRGFELADVAAELGLAVEWFGDDVQTLEALVSAGAWVIAEASARLRGANYATWIATVTVAPSRHGPPPDGLHAVVVCGVGAGGLLVLDPFFPSTGQPLRLPRELAPSVLTGRIVRVVPP